MTNLEYSVAPLLPQTFVQLGVVHWLLDASDAALASKKKNFVTDVNAFVNLGNTRSHVLARVCGVSFDILCWEVSAADLFHRDISIQRALGELLRGFCAGRTRRTHV